MPLWNLCALHRFIYMEYIDMQGFFISQQKMFAKCFLEYSCK